MGSYNTLHFLKKKGFFTLGSDTVMYRKLCKATAECLNINFVCVLAGNSEEFISYRALFGFQKC